MWQGFFQIALTLGLLVAIVPIFGTYIANVFLGEKTFLDPILSPLEQLIYKLTGVRFSRDMTGWQYARAMLLINLVMGVFVYLIISLQGVLPLNPMQLNAPHWDLTLHTTISFLTNTNQQHYAGEKTLSYASQVLALGFLMFTSAATGLAVSIAFIRGLTGRSLGNFYVDLIRSITRILLPISLIGAVILLSLGVPETLAGSQIVTPLDGGTQVIARGPIAHFEIIKQLGENGGGFFGANSAHPYENPNGFSNLIETLIMVSIPASLIYTFGIFTQDKKQAWLLFGMVFFIYSSFIIITALGEFQGNPIVNHVLGQQAANLEGKEIRFGWAESALWAVTTTGTMCGAVNGMLDSFMPNGGFSTLFNLFLQIVWGGQGTGTVYLFIFLILTVFLTGLMVGRNPRVSRAKNRKTTNYSRQCHLTGAPHCHSNSWRYYPRLSSTFRDFKPGISWHFSSHL